jgi:hypothetical protein
MLGFKEEWIKAQVEARTCGVFGDFEDGALRKGLSIGYSASLAVIGMVGIKVA